MRHPRVLVYERDRRLAALLENSSPTAPFLLKMRPPIVKDEPEGKAAVEKPALHWSLREPRTLEACLRLLHGGPGILVVRVANKLDASDGQDERDQEQRRRERAMHLLERVAWLRPETALVAVSEVADDALAGLAWELGATFVLFPPQPLHLFSILVAHLMHGLAPGRRGTDAVTELPVLDETKCTGCTDCALRVCPTDCLEMAGPLPWLPRPRDCVSCELCVWVCPVMRYIWRRMTR